MKRRTLLLVITFAFAATGLNAQFFKKIANRAAKAAEETVLQKVDEKTTKKTGNAMDTIFDSGSKNNKNKGPRKKPDTTENETPTNSRKNKSTVNSAKDFKAGNKVVFSDTFANDAIGDFPVTWNTNASAEVVTFEGDETRWLQMANSGIFIPEGITGIPENSTLEFDLHVGENYGFYSSGLYISLNEVNDKTKIFEHTNNSVVFYLHPKRDTNGATHFTNYVDGSKIIDNGKEFAEFSFSRNSVHISIWRQKKRVRIYVDDSKIWDIPRAFGDASYNSLRFKTGVARGEVTDHFYVANLRLAVAGEDKRHALLETGRFETNEILFDVGLSSLQTGSTSVLDELGQLLEDNNEFDLTIVGHTDADGAPETNQTLSEERAESVKAYLTDNFAIRGNRLKTEGRGASVPVASNETNDGKQKNRRVEFIKN